MYKVVLSPLSGEPHDEFCDALREAIQWLTKHPSELNQFYSKYPSYFVRKVGVADLVDSGSTSEVLKILQAKLDAITQNRVIEADLVKVVDDGSMLIGIDPGERITTTRAITSKRRMHAKALRIRRNNPEFYHLAYTAPGVRNPQDPSSTKYIITRKLKKILSVNLDNVISVDGKQVMGGMRRLNKGVQELGLDENWSVDSISDLLDE